MNADTARYNWPNIRSRLYALADAIGEKACDSSLPVPINKIVELRTRLGKKGFPTSVTFRPLFTDGCVVVTKTGFKIYVGCETDDARDYQRAFEGESVGVRLPPRIRSTISHEIGHTLLFDSVEGQPKGWVKVDHYRILEALEETCDHVAGHMLLPNDLIRAELRKTDLFLPDNLRSLAERANISAGMLIRRMEEMGGLISDRGAFGYVVDSKVVEFRSHASVSPLFQNIQLGQASSEFAKRATQSFVLNGGDWYKDTAVFAEQPEELRRFEFACESPESRGDRRGFYITARNLRS